MATRFIELSGQINHAMPEYVVSRCAEALAARGKKLNDCRILLLGLPSGVMWMTVGIAYVCRDGIVARSGG